MAVQKGAHTVLGAWTLTDDQWRPVEGPWWEFLLDEPISEWRRQWFDWCGNHPSSDIRKEL